jgi:hypothetical protein
MSVIPVLAHGVGGRSDLPLPVWLFAYGAAFALLISFVALRILWPKPRLAAAADGTALPGAGTPAARAVHIGSRAVGLFGFGVILYAGLWGVDNAGLNIAPYAVYIVFWVGFIVVCGLLGDIYGALNPFDTIAAFLRIPEQTGRANPGRWPAAAFLLSFAWLELAYHDPSSPRAVGVWLAVYTVAVIAGAAVWGRAWLRQGEGFAAVFELLGHIAVLGRDPETGRLAFRPPLAGLAKVPVVAGTTAVVVVALGSTTFDGVTRTRFWTDLLGSRSGWSRTMFATVGLVWVVAIVAALYLAAIAVAARITDSDPRELASEFVPSLVPIALAYAVAHYFSLLVFDGQNVYPLISDPFGRGWNLFGTIDYTVNYRVVSVRTIALVQAGAIVAGHVCGVIVAHDRAVELFEPRRALRSQYPLLAVMIVYTVGGLLLLLGG